MHTDTYAHAHIYTHTHACTHMRACTRARVHTHTQTHTCTCTHAQTHVHVHTQTHVRARAHTHTHTHTVMKKQIEANFKYSVSTVLLQAHTDCIFSVINMRCVVGCSGGDHHLCHGIDQGIMSVVQRTKLIICVVFRDPRARLLAAQHQKLLSTRSGPLPEKLSFKEKMKMFAMETGEDGTPRDKVKISRAQRDIDNLGGTPTGSSNNGN